MVNTGRETVDSGHLTLATTGMLILEIHDTKYLAKSYTETLETIYAENQERAENEAPTHETDAKD